MKKYINTSNYYLSTTTSKIESDGSKTWHFDVADITVDWVTLPLEGYYWVDVDFGDVSKREIFRIKKREGYRLFYDDRISPSWVVAHTSGASVGLRDFSQLLNSLSTNTDNFWEVEKLWDLEILVRGGVVYHTSNMNAKDGKILLNDKTFDSSDISTNSELYIVLENDELSWWDFVVKTELLLNEEWQYPIAKIVTWATNISEIIDLRATIIWQGNMRKEVYDPDWKKLDVYNYENFYNVPTQTTWDISDISDRAWKRGYWDAKQEELVWIWDGQNIHTINWQNIMWPGNFSLDTILTVGWDVCQTEDWAATFTFTEHVPLTDDAFIVFSDSGTMLIRGWENPNDYTYDNTTHTITFNNPLYEDEHAIVWVMYNDSTEQSQIGSADITLKYWENEATFNANQMDDITIDFETDLGLWDIANDSTITITQWGNTTQSFTTNQNEDQTITLQWNIPVTQDEYNNLPESKTTDGNWYWIVEEAE